MQRQKISTNRQSQGGDLEEKKVAKDIQDLMNRMRKERGKAKLRQTGSYWPDLTNDY